MKEHPIRAKLWNGGLYVIRDVVPTHDKPTRCQYAQTDSVGTLTWHDCIEGVEFADINPIGVE